MNMADGSEKKTKMQILKNTSIKLLKNMDESTLPTEAVPYLLKALESADPMLKADIENKIVEMGERVLPSLAQALKTTTGTVKGVVAMTLIRLGSPSIAALNNVFTTKEDRWVAEYVINEIRGSQISLWKESQTLQIAAV